MLSYLVSSSSSSSYQSSPDHPSGPAPRAAAVGRALLRERGGGRGPAPRAAAVGGGPGLPTLGASPGLGVVTYVRLETEEENDDNSDLHALELMQAMQKPKVMAALQECMSNPAAIGKYASDPEFQAIISKLQKVMPGGPMGGTGGGGRRSSGTDGPRSALRSASALPKSPSRSRTALSFILFSPFAFLLLHKMEALRLFCRVLLLSLTGFLIRLSGLYEWKEMKE